MSAIPYYRTGAGKSQAEISRQDGRAFAHRSRPWILLIQPCLHFNNKLFLYKLAIFFYKVTIFSQRTFLSLPGERILIFYPQQQHFHRFRIILSFYLLNHPTIAKIRTGSRHPTTIRLSYGGISAHKKSTCSSSSLDPESICHPNVI